MSTAAAHRVPHITVGHFYANHAETLGLRLEGASRGLNGKIREPTINRPGLALTGFYNYFAGKRIQVFGSAELSYLRSLSAATLKEKLRQLFSRPAGGVLDVTEIDLCDGRRERLRLACCSSACTGLWPVEVRNRRTRRLLGKRNTRRRRAALVPGRRWAAIQSDTKSTGRQHPLGGDAGRRLKGCRLRLALSAHLRERA